MIQSTVNHKRMLEMSSADTLSVYVCMCGICVNSYSFECQCSSLIRPQGEGELRPLFKVALSLLK